VIPSANADEGEAKWAAGLIIPSIEASSSLSSCKTLSSSLDMPDMKSSSESISGLAEVSGVGGAAAAAAEAILLLDLLVSWIEESTASAAFLFLSWEEMVSVVGGLVLELVRGRGLGTWTRLYA
jgi:hypothetical protein